MAQGDGAAVDVDDLRVEACLLDDGQRLGGEGLVEFDQLDVAEFQTGLFQGLGDGHYRADAHVQGVDAGDGAGGQAGDGLELELSDHFFAGDEREGGPVGGLRRVAGGDDASLCKDGAQFGERFGTGVAAHALVGVHDEFVLDAFVVIDEDLLYLNGYDLRFEFSFHYGFPGQLVGAVGEFVGLFPADAVFSGDGFGGQAHAGQVVRRFGGHPVAGGQFVAGHRHQAHAFGAACDVQMTHACLYFCHGNGNGLQS